MRCFSSNYRGVVPGLTVSSDERLGLIVFLGEKGRGRRFERVALGRKNPPRVIELDQPYGSPLQVVMEASPATIKARGKDGKEVEFVILEASRPDKRFLVRVNTQWDYTRKPQKGRCASLGTPSPIAQGYWKALKGEPVTVIMGHGAHGDAGRIGSWDDGLVIMSPGDVLRVRPEGGYKAKPYVLVHQGETLEQMSEEDWNASQNEAVPL